MLRSDDVSRRQHMFLVKRVKPKHFSEGCCLLRENAGCPLQDLCKSISRAKTIFKRGTLSATGKRENFVTFLAGPEFHFLRTSFPGAGCYLISQR